MKKPIILISLLLTVCMFFTACGSSTTSNNKTTQENKQTTSQIKQTIANKNTEKSTEKEIQACNHEWKKATCTTPNTCFICGKTSGNALGHDWQEATCIAPKTCTTCKTTSGTIVPQNHNGNENCTLCQKNYKEILKNHIFTKGAQIKSSYNDSAYWKIEYPLFIDAELHNLIIQYYPETDYISIDLNSKKQNNKENIYFGIYLNYTSYEYKYNYTNFKDIGSDIVSGTISANSFTSSTNKLKITSMTCNDGYHSEEFFSQQMAIHLKNLLSSMDNYFNTKSVGITVNQLGFTNYK